METTTLREAAVRFSRSYDTLASWCRRGAIAPAAYRGKQGAPVRLSAEDVAEVALIVRLQDLGLAWSVAVACKNLLATARPGSVVVVDPPRRRAVALAKTAAAAAAAWPQYVALGLDEDAADSVESR